MNPLASLGPAFAKNRVLILGAGAAVIAGVAVMSRRAPAEDNDGATTTTSPQNAGAYDSTASDVYNALQPQLEAVADQLDELNANSAAAGKPTTSTIPTPKKPAPKKPAPKKPKKKKPAPKKKKKPAPKKKKKPAPKKKPKKKLSITAPIRTLSLRRNAPPAARPR